jgi:hypothetical protein
MICSRKFRRGWWICAASITFAVLVMAQSLPTPEQFFGHPVGADKKLVRWDKQLTYFQTIAKGSDRVLYQELGKTTENNPLVMLVISSPANLKNIERLKQINRRLFDPRTIATAKEAQGLVQEGRIFVLITSSIHATEIGANQMAPEAVYRLATESTPEVRTILDNVVLLYVPSLNPDGQMMVIDWYNKNLGTPYEGSSMPWLYHKYVGHDNNRDAYMFTQKETQLIGKVLYQDWFPEVWLDQHQMGNSGARIFTMPAMDPINPNVDPLVYRNTGLLGYAQAAALEKAGKEGIINGDQYTYYWEGAMAWAGWWHNMLGMLTEVASVNLATPVEQAKAVPGQPPAADETAGRGGGRGGGRGAGGIAGPPRDTQFRVNYMRPWLGGRWTLRDIVDYNEIATFGLLEAAASLRVPLLDGLFVVGKRQVEMGKKGDPFAIVVPRDQSDRPTVVKMLQTLALGGVEVHQAQAAFTADKVSYPAGSYVILLAQPFRPYAKDMLEAQVYPKISPAPGQPPRAPYDVAGWSLGMQMGVETFFVKEPFEASLKKLDGIELPPGQVTGQGSGFLLSHELNNSLVAVNRLLKGGYQVHWLTGFATIGGRNYPAGTIFVQGGKDLASAMAGLTRSLGIEAVATDALTDIQGALHIRSPRTALYQPWGGGNMDEGWTRWLLEQNEFPFATVHPEDLRNGNPGEKFDVIIFPDMAAQQILTGAAGQNIPEPYRGGIEESGAKGLRAFIEGGGTVITIGRSTSLLIDKFGAPFKDALQGIRREDFFCPGSVLRVAVDNTHPIAYGMKGVVDSYFSNSMTLEAVPSESLKGTVIARYPSDNLLRSGWLQGESYLANKIAIAEVKLGKGRMVLMPLKVQQRAQPYATFKLLFNAILTSAVGQ